jgi:hypothetical protein
MYDNNQPLQKMDATHQVHNSDEQSYQMNHLHPDLDEEFDIHIFTIAQCGNGTWWIQLNHGYQVGNGFLWNKD